MVRKMTAVCLCMFVLCAALACPCSAKNYIPYPDAGISSSYVRLGESFLSRAIGHDYFFVRTGRYTYSFVYGDFDFGNGVITGKTGREVLIDTASEPDSISYLDVSDIRFSPGNSFSYSNLGSSPDLRSSEYYLLLLVVFVLVVWFVSCLIKAIFTANKR